MNNDLPEGIYKTTPESFVVQEIVGSDPPRAVSFCDESLIRGWEGDPYTIFVLSKRRWSTEDAMKEVARQLHVGFDDISVQGLKDKQAKTSQHLGVRGNFRDAFSHPDISLVQLYGQEVPLRPGDHYGNRFDISVISDADQINLAAAKSAPNIFGPQRLGRQEGSENVGRLFLEGKPEEAIELMLTTMGAKGLTQAMQEAGGSWKGALSHPSFRFSYRFEIQKWQSYLWNKLLLEQIDKLGPAVPDLLPMWNPRNQKVLEMYRHLWNPSQLETDVFKFLIKKDRPTMVRPKDFKANKKTGSWNFTFDLPPSAYASVILSQLFRLKERHIYA
ncbi:MAG: tRNA pseudouridine13 synthase [Parcubacteria group bacterium Gr01-1014_13]|nr:MAG: tRNA pseudouridine13 synthase [Parcubacteria group bacterium Gr01-1014_13]